MVLEIGPTKGITNQGNKTSIPGDIRVGVPPCFANISVDDFSLKSSLVFVPVGDVRPDLKSKARSREIRRSSIFEKKSDSKGKLARLFIAQAHQSNVSTFITQPVKAGSKNVGVITKRTVAKEDSKELVLRGDLVDDVARSGGNDSINNDDAVQRLDNFTSTEGISCDLAESPAVTNSGTSKSGIAPGENSSLIVTYSSSSSDCSD